MQNQYESALRDEGFRLANFTAKERGVETGLFLLIQPCQSRRKPLTLGLDSVFVQS